MVYERYVATQILQFSGLNGGKPFVHEGIGHGEHRIFVLLMHLLAECIRIVYHFYGFVLVEGRMYVVDRGVYRVCRQMMPVSGLELIIESFKLVGAFES